MADYRSRGHAYLSRVIRRPHVLTSDELMTIIEDARDRGVCALQAYTVQPSAMAALTKRSQQSGTESCVGYGHVPGEA